MHVRNNLFLLAQNKIKVFVKVPFKANKNEYLFLKTNQNTFYILYWLN